MKRALLLPGCLSGLAAGLVLGRSLRPGPLAAAAPTADSTTTVSKGAVTRGTPALPAITSRRQGVHCILAYANGDRSRTLNEIIHALRNDPAALRLLAQSCLDIDPENFVRCFVSDCRPDARNAEGGLLYTFIVEWGKRDAAAAVRTCLNFEGDIRDWLGGRAVQALLTQDPTTALSLLAQNPTLELNWQTIIPLPATAENIALVRSMEASPNKISVLAALAASLPPDEGFAICETDPHLPAGVVWHKAAPAMVKQDPTAAKAWFLSHPGHPAATPIAFEIANSLTKSNPAEGFVWVRDHYHGSFRNVLIDMAARSLDKTDPGAAAAARELLPAAYKFSGKP